MPPNLATGRTRKCKSVEVNPLCQTEQVKDKLKQYAAKLTEQLDYIQGSLNATTDVRVTLQSHLETLESKHKVRRAGARTCMHAGLPPVGTRARP